MPNATTRPDTQLQSRTEDIEGVRVHYMVGGGEESGPSKRVLLLHGWGGSIQSWESVTRDLLNRGYRVLVLDFPGFGESSLPPEPWGVPEYTGCLRTLLTRLDYHPTHIIAHSFGGRVAIMLAADSPEMLQRMVLAASAGIRIVSNRVKLARTVSKTVRAVFSIPGLSLFKEQAMSTVRKMFASGDYLNAGPLRDTFVKVINQDLRDYASRIKASTLLVWGDQDTETPLEQAKVLNELIADSGLVVFNGAGHYCYLDQFGRFSIVVAEFLK